MKTSTGIINSKSIKHNNKQQHTEQKMDQMLLQLRKIINSNSNNKNSFSMQSIKNQHNSHNNSNKAQLLSQQKTMDNLSTNIDVESMISQSDRLLDKRKDFSSIKPSTKGKIMAASELLREEKDMIKSYVKDKIQSELFISDNYNNGKINANHNHHNHNLQQQQQTNVTTDRHLIRLQQQRKLLINKKRQQQQKQNNRRQQLISQVKEFQTDSRVGVDIHQINSLIFKQQPQSGYLLNDYNNNSGSDIGNNIKSRSNEVKSSSLYISQVYDQHEIQQTSRINNNKMLQQSKAKQNNLNKQQDQSDEDNLQFVQVHDDIQQSGKYDQYYYHDSEGKELRNVLKKYPHFVQIFYQFIKNQWAITKLQGQSIQLGSTLMEQIFHNNKQSNNKQSQSQSTTKNSNGYVWKNKKIKQQIKPRKLKQTITSITQNFKFKPFTISEQTKIQIQRQKISQRRINKMIGESAKFHPKKCVLTKNQLIYYEEKQTNSTDKFVEICIPQTTKYINLEIQRVGVEVLKKEEGSFFSKKESNIEVVSVKGKVRTFKFQHDFLQGRQLMSDLKKLMAAKVYTLGCKINGMSNLELLRFIYSTKMNKFSLASSLVPIQYYPIKQDKAKHLNILIDSLTDHPQTDQINLNNAKLQPNEIILLLKQSKKLQKLIKIDLSNMRLGKQNFLELCQFVNQIKTPLDGLEVILSNCKLDDDCFISNVGVFTTFCTRVQRFDISNNNITVKTVQIIKNCLQNVTSQIKYLNISNCPIRDLIKLNQLIKQSRKLQQLQAENLFLSFDQKRFEELERFFDFLKENSNNNIKRINLSRNGALTRKQYSMIENVWYQQSIEQLMIDLDLEMVNGEKTGKELMRTDNNANTNKNGLSMKLYKRKDAQSI